MCRTFCLFVVIFLASPLFVQATIQDKEYRPAFVDSLKKYWSVPDSTCFYGKPIFLQCALPSRQEFARKQLRLRYRYGTKVATEVPFTERCILPRIPASAKSVEIGLVWKYPESGQVYVVRTQSIVPHQAPPEINGLNAKAVMSSSGQAQRAFNRLRDTSLVTPPNFAILIRGIKIDYAIPIDAKSDVANRLGQSIYASWRNVKPAIAPTIDYNSPETNVRVFDGSKPDRTSIWVPNATVFQLDHSTYDKHSASFRITIRVRDLPPMPPGETRALFGSVAFKMAAKLTNPHAAILVSSGTQRVAVPLAVTYGAGLTDVTSGFTLPPAPKPIPPVGARLYHRKRYDEDNPPPVGVTMWIEEYDEDETPLDSTKLVTPVCAQCSDTGRRFPVWKVCDSALQSRVYTLLTTNKSTTTTNISQPQAAPMLLCGELNRNGTYEPVFIRIGDHIFTRGAISRHLPRKVKDTLFAPITERGYGRYCFQTLPPDAQTKIRVNTIEEAVSQKLYQTTDTSRNSGYTFLHHSFSKFDNYRHAGFALFEADSAVMMRLRETITPGYPRTSTLDSAEAACSTSKRIREHIALGHYVPQSLIDSGTTGGAFPSDCEMVQRYYLAETHLVRIGRVYVIANLRSEEPEIIGIAGVVTPTRLQESDPDFIPNALNGPIMSAVFGNEQLRKFTTQEFITEVTQRCLAEDSKRLAKG